MTNVIKIVIADDHPILRRGVIAAIEIAPDVEIVGEADTGEAACALVASKAPDVVILDIEMPVLDGVEAAKIISEKHPHVKIIFLTMHKSKDLLKKFKSLRVSGYILKDSAVLEILSCIRQVVAGKSFISPVIAELAASAETEKPAAISEYSLSSLLTPAESRIMKLLAKGKTNKEIANEVFVSVRTVENHRSNISLKLRIKGNHALLKFALEHKHLLNNNDE